MQQAIRKVDSNQAAIVEDLRKMGISVLILSGVGQGCPDLLLGYRGINLLYEVKNLEGRGKVLTDAEQDFFDCWRGQVDIITDTNDAIALLRSIV